MKLQGKNVKNLPKDKKRKMEETLKVMTETRKEDSVQLRKQIQDDILHLDEELKKAKQYETQLRGQLETIIIQKHRLDGALIALSKLL